MILYIVDDNTAIQAFTKDVVPEWCGDTNVVGFFWDNDHLIYVAESNGLVLRSIVELAPRSMGLVYYYRLFRQPDNKWHTDPETGSRICYRYLHPIEYIFGA